MSSLPQPPAVLHSDYNEVSDKCNSISCRSCRTAAQHRKCEYQFISYKLLLLCTDAVLQNDGENHLDRSCKKLCIYVVKEERNIKQTVKIRKANRICHILHRHCLLEHVAEGKIEGRIEGMVRRGRRRKQLLDDLNENKWTL